MGIHTPQFATLRPVRCGNRSGKGTCSVIRSAEVEWADKIEWAGKIRLLSDTGDILLKA